MKYICILIVGMWLPFNGSAFQKDTDTLRLEVGKPLPYFEIDSINDFSLPRASPANFKGKWLIIDFWDKYCLSCIESLPVINTLQKKYKNDLQYLLIGREDNNHGIRKIYDKFRKALDLQIPHAFDSSLFRKFDVTSCPRIIIVTPDGLVYAVTNHLTDHDIGDILADRRPQLNKIYQQNETPPQKYTLSESEKSVDSTLLFRSVLNKWTPSIQGSSGSKVITTNGYYEAIGRSINDLYMLAYFGQDGIDTADSLYTVVAGKPVFDMSEKQKNIPPFGTTVYCYRLSLPPERDNPKNAMLIMQHDLNNYFGYHAAIEERKMPCWKLIASAEARKHLKTKGGHKLYEGRIDTGFVAKNCPVKEIISKLVYVDAPVIDHTGIDGNIDITLRHVLTNIEEIQKGLKENGLSLVKSQTKMKVLVIRAAKPD
ncbi:thioredoxin-like domain-containing protein [Chitinophaga arvensicola]|uniref:Thioredoxin domain-containing protein n=1 Tax=Chitinophaga arvensicola TaxID=29529 RepID=A0A1I0RP61_9BACT|nr:thioredoxin-like domain-containing protein [Chitinophaga arvensicola]SEW43085.1 Protein of unknown function [Chitinophaga arvensicola]